MLQESLESTQSLKEGSSGCAVTAIADLNGPSVENTQRIIASLLTMSHRVGMLEAEEADGSWRVEGDGAGIATNYTPKYVQRHLGPDRNTGNETPLTGALFLPKESENGHLQITEYQRQVDEALISAGFEPLGHRIVPTHPEILSQAARETAPVVTQFFVGRGNIPEAEVKRRIYEVEQRMASQWNRYPDYPYLVGLSEMALYKAQCTPEQLIEFYKDDFSRLWASSVDEGHGRWATNTKPNWKKPHPFSKGGIVVEVNGEINSVRGNRVAVSNLEQLLKLRAGEEGGSSILTPGGSDSQHFSDYIGFLTAQGIPLEAILRYTMPSAWWLQRNLSPQMVARFEENRRLYGKRTEWEGPQFIVASDGQKLVCAKDRMGLRPAWMVKDGSRILISSEIGAHPFDRRSAQVQHIRAGEIYAVDTKTGSILTPKDIHQHLIDTSVDPVTRREKIFISNGNGKRTKNHEHMSPTAAKNLLLYGWTTRDMDYLNEWLNEGKEPRGSMGKDWVDPWLSPNHPPLDRYARPIYANCTNPPVDPELEAGYMDTVSMLGDPRAAHYRMPTPFITPEQLRFIECSKNPQAPKVKRIDCIVSLDDDSILEDPVRGATLFHSTIERIVQSAAEAIEEGHTIIILSHENACPSKSLPLDSIVVASALNTYLAQKGLREKAKIVIESPILRDRHSIMTHMQVGADFFVPTTIFEHAKKYNKSEEEVVSILRDALLKAMSLPGITTYEAFKDSKLIEFYGVGPDLMRYFPGIESRLAGIDMGDLFEDTVHRFTNAKKYNALPKWKEPRMLSPQVVDRMRELAISGEWKKYLAIQDAIYSQNSGVLRLHHLLDLEPVGQSIPLDEVMTEEEIINAFFCGAHMSVGALGDPAHEAIALFFNGIPVLVEKLTEKTLSKKQRCYSGSGEGGMSRERLTSGCKEDRISADMQVAPNRYGVTIFVVADENVYVITQKTIQGVKPCESADCPKEKNDEGIAENRFTREKTRLRSVVRNRDLQSIESYGEWLTVFKEANPEATFVVKAGAGSSMGPIAIGVMKGGFDVFEPSGGEGGTGSASKQAIETTGGPSILGIADGRNAFAAMGLNEALTINADGGWSIDGDSIMRAFAIGARRIRFGTASMQGVGCRLLRQCHVPDGCKPGVATRRPELHENFMALEKVLKEQNKGKPIEERIMEGVRELHNLFWNLAHHVRLECARLGVKNPAELDTRYLKRRHTGNKRFDQFDLSVLTDLPQQDDIRAATRRRIYRIDTTQINRQMMEDLEKQLAGGEEEIVLEYEASNKDLAIGTRLAGDWVRNPEKYNNRKIILKVRGTPGFGCFGLMHPGMTGIAEGWSGDNFAMSMMEGCKAIARPHKDEEDPNIENVRVGENALYGSTGGEAYVEGGAAGGFCFRACGSLKVVHIGPTGNNAYNFVSGPDVRFIQVGAVGEEPFVGMTCGKGYVLGDNNLKEKMTHDSVELIQRPLNSQEEAEVKSLLRNHIQETGSQSAQEILENWETHRNQWTIVEANEENARSAKGVTSKARMPVDEMEFVVPD